MSNAAWVYPLALLFDLVVGDPRSNLHPVALIGRLIAWLERRLLAICGLRPGATPRVSPSADAGRPLVESEHDDTH